MTCLLILLIQSCNDRPEPPQPKKMDTSWTLLPAPNALDTVGTIFAVDSFGVLTRIPGGTLLLHISNNPIQIAEQSKNKTVSWGAMASFLGTKGLINGADASFNDSTTLEATFKITNGQLSSFDDDLPKAFAKKSELIAHNVKFLKLEDQKLYLVLETIRSGDINISFDNTNDMKSNLSVDVEKLVKLNPHLSISLESKNDLVYKLDYPLIVFYHLRPIDVNVISGKGGSQEQVNISLGDTIQNQQVLEYR